MAKSPRQTRVDFGAVFNNISAPVTGNKSRDYGNLVMPKTTAAQNRAGLRPQVIGDRAREDAYKIFDQYLKSVEKLDANEKAKEREALSNDIAEFNTDVNVTPNIESLEGAELKKAAEDLFNGNGFGNKIENFGKSVLSTVGEIASRPIYAANNAGKKVIEAFNEGENPLSVGDDALYGAWRGFSGQDKTTPGDFYEFASSPEGLIGSERTPWGQVGAAVLNPISFANSGLRATAGENNVVSRNINRGYGFAGETIGDPVNLVGGKAVSVIGRGVGRGSNASRASADVIESLYDEVATSAARGIPRVENRVLRGGRKSVTNPGTIRGGSTTLPEKVSTAMADAADAATLTPSGRAVAINNARTVQAVAVKGVTEARTQLLSNFEKTIARVKAGGLTIGSKEWDRLASRDEVIKAFDDAYRAAMNPKNLNPMAMRSRSEIIEEATDAARRSIDDDLVQFSRNLEDQLNASMYNTFAIRVGNRQIPLKFMGRGYAAVKKKAPGVGAPRAFSYDKQLPGLMGQSVGNARRIGHVNYETFLREMRPIARKYSAADRAAISRYIHNLVDPATFDDDLLNIPEHLRDGIVAIKDDYARILQEELEAGVRAGSDEVPFNYQYLHFNYDDFRPGATTRRSAQEKLKGRGQFRGQGTRKAEVAAEGKLITGPEQAKAMGLKPVEDPFEALAQRRLRSERLKSRSTVTDAFFRTYGITDANMSAETARELGLVKIASPDNPMGFNSNNYKINRTLQGYMNTTGESLYLPKDVAGAYENYIKLADVNTSEELSSYLRLYDKALNTFKMTATIPFPGFHVKNMAGDIYMGYLDGVRSMDYTRFARGSRSGTYKFKNGTQMSVEDFNTLFSRYGKSGGFVETELFPSTNMSGTGVKETLRAGGDKIRTASEIREDFGRKVHFFHALDEELAANKVKSINPAAIDKKAQKALDSATWRINKYKFDYGALTSTEKAVMRRVIPFYTFLRKSAPLMLEGMLMNPSQYGKTYRFFGDEEGFGPRAAQWQRELGFAAIGNENSPLIFPSNVLPTDAMTTWGRDPLSASNFSDSFINSMSPILKAPIELGMNRSTFTGQELFNGEQPSTAQQGRYLLDALIPGVKTIEEDVVQPVLKSTGLREDENVQGITEDPMATLFGSRLGLGLGARRLDQESQRRNINSDMGWYDQELKKYSEGIQDYGIKIFLSRRTNGNSIKVRTLDGKKTLYDGDLQGALEVVDQYTKNPRNKVKEGNERVNYVDGETGVVRKNRPASEMTSLDRVLEF